MNRALTPAALVRGAVASLAASALLLSGNAWSASDEAFQHAFDSFAKASAGDDSAVDAAASAFAALRKAEPANPVLTAYAGASITLQARAALSPLKKLSLAETAWRSSTSRWSC
ncbi:MAG TPA: hypothetical protein VMU47_24250 [Caldimonas sp.]|nr:hypothetical protein [Caldimonas sp.]